MVEAWLTAEAQCRLAEEAWEEVGRLEPLDSLLQCQFISSELVVSV